MATDIRVEEPSHNHRRNYMSYVRVDFPSKKAFIAAVKAGRKMYTYNPSGMFETPQNGNDVIEGPHYPKPHKWYASVVVENGVVVKAK